MLTLPVRLVGAHEKVRMLRYCSQKLTFFQISELFAADPVMTGINYGGEYFFNSLYISQMIGTLINWEKNYDY